MSKVYTCTMNLAIDLFIETEELLPRVVNRTIDDDIQANGKGVNVSLVLKMLGVSSTALGFSGGFTGNYIEAFLKEKKIATDFVPVEGLTRINVFTQVNAENTEYKLVNQGPEIQGENTQALLEKISQLEADDYLCVSGSLPRGVPPTILVEISRICYEIGVHLIIDSSYKEILDCLKYQPFLLKPNDEELSEWFGKELLTEDEYIAYGEKLIAAGAKNVLLSLGGDGAIFINQDTCVKGNAPTGRVVNTACAGDTLLGTFLAGLIQGQDTAGTLRRSLAAGSSTAFQKGLTDFSDVPILEEQIKITRRKEND
ncbi:1-phosphofructokinase [Enterococcus sp. 669A]|uniref:Tagatose-6-phosphate kinase n=1 Tax=Candidatus Enterococcus moelleringii TaxID=2815325 RepID=A0ABS3L9C7_9ENTE|nr:1-phosphofructokinase [Enterococcus sp. 669A]MBO1306217.1 1-phosphofructokinase [Enterococcus sp. 669A]